VADGQRNGSEQVEALVQARIITLKCRADETLTLVARGDGPEYEDDFKKLSPQISGDTEANFLVRARNLASTQQLANEVTAAQIAAQSPSDNNNVSISADRLVRRRSATPADPTDGDASTRRPRPSLG